MLHTGDEPKKVDTGELESVLPSWLQEAREQNRNAAAAEEATKTSAAKPKVQKNDPLDLLAGLASQSDSDDEAVPDWLASINPVTKQTPTVPPTSKQESSSDFFSQFSQKESQPAKPAAIESDQEQMPDWKKNKEPAPEQNDQLGDWFSQGSAETSTPSLEPAADDNAWMANLGVFSDAPQESPTEKQPEDLSWLHNLESESKQTGGLSTPQPGTGFDFGSQTASDQEDLSWLNSLGETPAPSFEEPKQPASSQEDLSWLNNLGGTPAPSFEEPKQPASAQEDLGWLNNLGEMSAPSFEEPKQPASAQEDLGWLNNLGEISAPSFEEPKQPASSQEDLSWLNTLNETTAPSFEEPKQPASSQEDMSWLKTLGGTPAPSFDEPEQPASSQEDMSWLKTLGGTPAPSFDEPKQPVSSQEDMSWLNTLGETPVPSSSKEPQQPASSQEDLGWLNTLGSTEQPSTSTEPASSTFDDNLDWMKNLGAQESTPAPEKPQYTPRVTAPLHEGPARDTTPDWLKSAMAEPTMPVPGELSMDWFSQHGRSVDATPTPELFNEAEASGIKKPTSASPRLDLPSGDSSGATSQDVDSLFNVEMPDWLSREPEGAEAQRTESAQMAGDESLAPVELPSWVQAMRPVESAVEDLSASDVDQVTEREGPLAGFRGIIPFVPIGSSLRPKAVSLKLQVSDEQQTGAGLIEKIISSESMAQPPKSAAMIAPQRILRWILTGLFVIILSLVIGLGMHSMPIYASATVNELSGIVANLPENPQILVVVDYEPSLAGELEVAAGPVLDQLALSRHSIFTFISMSPNGSGLVERLMSDTDLSRSLGYQAGAQYFNPGFLPGGSAGILGFIENPRIMPEVKVESFSNFETVILITDNSESGRLWVEQLEFVKSHNPLVASKPLFVISSAQAGPMMQPYVSSGQVDVMVSGLSNAVQYEYVNNTQLRTARSYWDAFGIGLALAVVSIVLGSLWNLLMGIRERRAEAEQE